MDVVWQPIIESLANRKAVRGGIRTAADWLAGMTACLGDVSFSEKFGGLATSDAWSEAMKAAAQKLTYSDDDMVSAFAGDTFNKASKEEPTPGACLDFACVITTTKQDRDRDVLETDGAILDPKAPLLWQHIPMEPIGKLIRETKRTKKRLEARFAIADTTLGRDAATLTEFGALRISHGFIPSEFEPLDKDADPWVSGWRIKQFEIVEVSLVSVPSNTDAVITAFSRAKLHHPAVKAFARGLADVRPASVVGGFDGATAAAKATATCQCSDKPSAKAIEIPVSVKLSVTTDDGAGSEKHLAIGTVHKGVPSHVGKLETERTRTNMLKLTDAIKSHLCEKFGLAADATDDQARQLLGEKVMSGEISAVKFHELAGDRVIDPQVVLGDAVQKEVAKAVEPLAKTLGVLADRLATMQVAQAPVAATQVAPVAQSPANPPGDPLLVAAKAAQGNGHVRVRGAWENYENTRKTAICPITTAKGTPHFRAGQPATHMGRSLNESSELDKAVSAMYVKWALQPQLRSMGDYPRWLKWTDHDQELLDYALREMSWTGMIKGDGDGEGGYKVDRQKLTDVQRKDLLDDSTSGGLEAAPIVFDDAVILTPVLFGELFPLVDVVNLTRGRRVEGWKMSNPTFTSGTAEGTAISPFSTTGFITAMDTTIFPVVSAIRLGLDFEEDTPNDIGAILTQQFGVKLMEWLDNQIANGDGTTEPQGIFVGSGTTVVTTDNGTGGPPTVSDYEALMFGVSKADRNALGGNRVVFLANDTTYSRARGIPVGPADERRVFNMTHQDYRLFEYPYKIQNDISNSNAAFVNLAGYRLYRRLGMTIRIEMGGQTLALANEKLIVVRGRFGGQLTRGAYAAVSSTFQS